VVDYNDVKYDIWNLLECFGLSRFGGFWRHHHRTPTKTTSVLRSNEKWSGPGLPAVDNFQTGPREIRS